MASFLPRLFTAVLPRVRPFREMGVSGTPVYAGYVLSPERSPKLIGQEKYRTFSQILANTSIVAAGVRYFLNIVAKPSWSCEPADKSDEAKKYAEFVEDVLDDLHTPWSRVVRRAGTYRFHGFDIEEWTAKRREDGKIGFHDIERRPQWTIWRWEVDERGTVTGAWQRDPLTGRELGLPRGKVMYLVDDTLTDSPEGMGLLRHCVEPAARLESYMKQEAFGYLRDLHGVPVGRAPMDELASAVQAQTMTQAQMDAAVDKLKQFCAMEEKTTNTSIVLNSQPYIDVTDTGNTVSAVKKWDVELINGGAPGLVPVGQAIVRLNTEIARILGVEHLLLGADAAGSYALAKEKATDLYLLANSVVNDIGLQAQHDLIWSLWSLNGFPDKMMPNLKHEDVQPKDVEQISRVLRDMATAGAALQPDDEVQNFIRDLLGAPHVDLQKLQEQMEEQMQQEAAISMAGGGYGAGAGAGGGRYGQQPKVPTTDQEQKQEDAAQKALDARARVDQLIAKSSNGQLPELQKLRDALDEIIDKVVPYNEAAPYRDEDEFIAGRAGASDGAMNADQTFDQRRRLKPTGPNPLVGEGNALNVGDELTAQDIAAQTSAREDFADEGTSLNDAGTPGARLRVTGRQRTV